MDGEASKREVGLLMEAVAAVKTEFATVKQDVSFLKQDTIHLKNSVENMKDTIGNMKEDVRSVKSDMSSIREDVDYISDKAISELRASISELSNQVKLIAGTVSKTSTSTHAIHKALFEESPSHSSILTLIKNTKEGLELVKARVDNVEASRKRPSDSGNYSALKESKKTVLTIIITMLTTAAVGFVSSAIWDKLKNDINQQPSYKPMVEDKYQGDRDSLR